MLAEIVDRAGLRDFVERQIADHTGGGHHGGLVFIDDPFAAPAGGGEKLFVWLADDLAVASPDPAEIARVAGIVLQGDANPFTESDFHAEIAKLYEEGAEIIVAADLEGVLSTTMSGESAADIAKLERLGVVDVRHLLLEQKQLGPKTHHRASLTFKQARSGLASWLAPPAPMGALDFISPDAQLAGAFVFKDPVKLLDDLYDLMSDEGDFAPLADFEQRHGFSVRDDLAAALGGELAVALDGPILPEPSWKIVLEVYDPARLQWAVEEGLAELNTHLQQEGLPAVELRQEEIGGRVYYSLEMPEIDVHYTFAEGYMLLAANRTLLDRAIRFRDSGYTITDSARFKSLLPADGRNNFSGLVYQDLSGVMKSVAERLGGGQLSEEQQRSLAALQAESAPMLGYAYGDETSILVAASSDNDALSTVMLYLLGMKNPAGFEQLLEGL